LRERGKVELLVIGSNEGRDYWLIEAGIFYELLAVVVLFAPTIWP
jgi:hypothetical protein